MKPKDIVDNWFDRYIGNESKVVAKEEMIKDIEDYGDYIFSSFLDELEGIIPNYQYGVIKEHFTKSYKTDDILIKAPKECVNFYFEKTYHLDECCLMLRATNSNWGYSLPFGEYEIIFTDYTDDSVNLVIRKK